MRTRSLLSLTCMSVVLGIALNGNQTARSEEVLPQPDATGTNSISSQGGIGLTGSAVPAGIKLNSAFAELVRLVQAGVEESVILAYIENTLRLFELDADGIIYLTDLGAPAGIIKAAMDHDQQLIQKGISPVTALPEAVPPEEGFEEIEEPSQEVTVEYFYDTLTPYGVWVDIDGYGRCWRPSVAIYKTAWQPYCDNGYWIYTDHGWYWMSGYSWGWETFHYGRWFRHSRYGWCWWPDTVWAPSWVCWRYDRSFCGWAPLPPHTYYRSGIGMVYHGSRVSVGFDFGLNIGMFTFVATRDFCDPQPWRHRVDRGEASRIYSRTTVFHKINDDQKNRRISNSGIPHRDIAAAARRDIRPVSIHQVNRRSVRGNQQYRSDVQGRTFSHPGQVSHQKTTPATTRPDVQRPHRTEQHDGSTTAKSSGERGSNHRNSQTPPPQQKNTPRAPSGQQVKPQRNESSSSPQRPKQSYRSDPAPKEKQSPKAKTPASPQKTKRKAPVTQ